MSDAFKFLDGARTLYYTFRAAASFRPEDIKYNPVGFAQHRLDALHSMVYCLNALGHEDVTGPYYGWDFMGFDDERLERLSQQGINLNPDSINLFNEMVYSYKFYETDNFNKVIEFTDIDIALGVLIGKVSWMLRNKSEDSFPAPEQTTMSKSSSFGKTVGTLPGPEQNDRSYKMALGYYGVGMQVSVVDEVYESKEEKIQESELLLFDSLISVINSVIPVFKRVGGTWDMSGFEQSTMDRLKAYGIITTEDESALLLHLLQSFRESGTPTFAYEGFYGVGYKLLHDMLLRVGMKYFRMTTNSFNKAVALGG